MPNVRIAARSLLRTPAFTLTAILTLGLALGAIGAAFAILDTHLLRPLPYPDTDRLVAISETNERTGDRRQFVAPANYADLRRSSRSLEAVAASLGVPFPLSLLGDQDALTIQGLLIEPEALRILGAAPILGRLPTDDEGVRDRVALISHGLFASRFGADPALIGRTIRYDDQSVTVLGVLPPGFRTPFGDADLYLPLAFGGRHFDQNRIENRSVHYLTLVGRLRPGVDAGALNGELSAFARELASRYPDSNAEKGLAATPLRELVVGETKKPLLILAAAVGCLLLIAATNVAGLFVARLAARERERAVREALGAGPLRLLLPHLHETALVAGLGTGLGLVLALLAVRVLGALEALELPRRAELAVTGRGALVVGGIGVLVALAIGLAPALRRGDLDRLVDDGRRRTRLRSTLTVAQVALSLVLLTGASLLVRSFTRLLARDPGFAPRGALSFHLGFPKDLREPAARLALWEAATARLAALPGVVAVGGTTRLAFGAKGNMTTAVTREGVTGERVPPEAGFTKASEGYFRAMGIPVKTGRAFERQDGPAGVPVLLVSETAARRLWPGVDALGKRVRLGPDTTAPWRTVVGIVGDVRHHDLADDGEAEVYVPFAQSVPNAPNVVVRTTGDPLTVASAIRREILALAPEALVVDLTPMERLVDRSLVQRRLGLALATGLAVVAVALAALGLYGLLSTSVARRTREIGIRVAVGARVLDVIRLVVGEGLLLAGIGLAVGLAGAAAATRLMRSLLVDVTPGDPVALASSATLLLAVALLASYLPARRAAHVDPLVALRHD